MQYVETNKTRRIVGQIDSMQSFNGQLIELCEKEGIRCGYIRAAGSLSSVTWIGSDGDTQETISTTHEGEKIFLLSLEGTIAPLNGQVCLDAKVFLSHPNDTAGRGAVAGQLVDCIALAVDFVLVSYDDLDLKRYRNRETGDMRIDYSKEGALVEQLGTESTPVPEERSGAEVGVNEVGALSNWKSAARKADALLGKLETTSVKLMRGDILMHPVLGQCKVVKIEGDSMVYIRIRDSRKLSKLSLDYIDLKLQENVGKTRVFQVEVGRS